MLKKTREIEVVLDMYYVGIDIGSTASKTVIMGEEAICDFFTLPTGWSGKETSELIYSRLEEKGLFHKENSVTRIVATGYGRICVDYADRIVTEITCHGKGGYQLFQKDCTIVDVGGQDTKVITVSEGMVKDFLMNDKCAAGTGKFLEVMALRLGVSLAELFGLAERGIPLGISSMCTVFAESEVISHIGAGEKREDIAAGVTDSVAARVSNLCRRHGIHGEVVLTGGLCDSPCFIQYLSRKLGTPVQTHTMGRYAGALGAALIAKSGKNMTVSTV